MDTKELSIPQLGLYLHQLGKYDEQAVLIPIMKHIEEEKDVNYLRLRPNGIDAIKSVSNNVEMMEKRFGFKWGSEYIKIKR